MTIRSHLRAVMGGEPLFSAILQQIARNASVRRGMVPSGRRVDYAIAVDTLGEKQERRGSARRANGRLAPREHRSSRREKPPASAPAP